MEEGRLLIACTALIANYKATLEEIKASGVSEETAKIIDAKLSDYERIKANGFDAFIDEAVSFAKDNLKDRLF